MNKPWKMGLVGAGRGSSYGNLAFRHPDCEIVALCDANEQALARHQRDLQLPDSQCFTDYELFIGCGMLDAVIVGTPIPFHAEQAVLALNAGIHVFSEVTAANTVDGCAEIIKATRTSGRIYMLAENTIYRPLFKEWEQRIQSGQLGEIIYGEADYLHPIPSLLVNPQTGKGTWRANRPPIHYCSHSIGPLLYLTGDRIVRAMAVGDGHRILPEAPIGGVDIQLAVFETQRKAILKMTRTQAAPRHPPIHYYHLQGTKGFVETDRLGADPQTHVQHGVLYVQGEMQHAQRMEWPEHDTSLPDYVTLGGHGTCDYSTFLQFLKALETGQKPRLDEIRAWDLTVPGLIAAESIAQNGKWLDVPRPE